jgi:hypothetical protein
VHQQRTYFFFFATFFVAFFAVFFAAFFFAAILPPREGGHSAGPQWPAVKHSKAPRASARRSVGDHGEDEGAGGTATAERDERRCVFGRVR